MVQSPVSAEPVIAPEIAEQPAAPQPPAAEPTQPAPTTVKKDVQSTPPAAPVVALPEAEVVTIPAIQIPDPESVVPALPPAPALPALPAAPKLPLELPG